MVWYVNCVLLIMRGINSNFVSQTKVPEQGDWEKVILYGDKVRRITYEESANNVSTTVFPIFEEYRPR